VGTTEGSTTCNTPGRAGRHVKLTGQRTKECHAAGLVIIICPRRRYSACQAVLPTTTISSVLSLMLLLLDPSHNK